MFFIHLICWLRLRLTPVEQVTVIHLRKTNIDNLKKDIALHWPKGVHFAYLVEKNPGDKWVPEEYEEEHVLGIFRSSDAVGKATEKLTLRLIEERTMRRDRYINPDWVCLLIL